MSNLPHKETQNRGGHDKKMKPAPPSGLRNRNTKVKGDTRTAADHRANARNGHQNKKV